MKKRYLWLILILAIGHVVATAQSYAVTAGLQVNSFSVYLTDYGDPGNTYVNLISTDDRTVYPVLLKVEISGQGYLIKSKQGFLGGQYLELQKNQLVTLTGTDIPGLFDPDKLDFIGFSQAEFLSQGGRLPDGPVVISIVAHDVVLDKAVSNVAMVSGVVQLNSPPQIMSPLGEQIPQTPQNLQISWMPQHSGNFITEYDLEVYEKNMDFSDDLIINSSAPFFEMTTLQTSYQFSELDPLLVQGQEYLIRVRARDITGMAAFENEGWSEIEYFVYGLPGIATCYQTEAEFCVAFCDYTMGTLVCENASYQIQVPAGGGLQSALNKLGIGTFDVDEIIAPPDEYGYCHIYMMVSAEDLTEVPVSLLITSGAFSSHCVPESEQGDGQPGFYGQGNGTPINIGNELSFDFLVCPDNTPVVSCEPPADAGLSVIADYPIMAEFSWLAVPDQFTTAFQVEFRPMGSQEWFLVEDISADSLKTYIGNLAGGQVYEARVRSVCGEELFLSDWSGIIEFNTTCIIPNSAWVADKDDKSAQIEWSPLAYAMTYELNFREIGATKWKTISTTSHQVTLTDLSPNTTYEYRLRVLCSETWGGFTPNYEFTTDRQCEGNTIVNQWISEITYHSARLTWLDEGELSTDQYSVRYRPVGSTVWQVAFADEPVRILEFLNANTWYQYSISRFCTDVWSDWSMMGSFLTTCAPPVSVWVETISHNSAVLNAAESGIRYEFHYRQRNSDSEWITHISDLASWSISSLYDDTEYEFKVRVKCDEHSEWSEFSEVRFFKTGLRCDPPGVFELGEITPFSVILGWEVAPRPQKWGFYYRRTDGTPILSEQLEGGSIDKISSSITEEGWVYQVCLEPELSIEQLVPDKWYDYKVESWCAGFGWTTDADIQQFRTRTNCKVPADIFVSFVGTDSASVHWISQNEHKSYHVEIREKGTPLWNQFTTKSPGFNFSNLTPDITYEYRVQSLCDNYGWTEWSQILEFRTDECISPTQVSKEYLNSNNSILISWIPSAGENHYQVDYRLRDSLQPQVWAMVETSADYVELSDLQTNRIYEYRVAEQCLSAGLFYNQGVDTFLLGRSSLNNEYFECGLPIQIFDPENFYPLDNLLSGDSVTAGDFKVLITEVNGHTGIFSGRGYIPVPYFNRARVNVKFKNIKVNDEYRLVEGKIKVTGVGLQIISEETAALLNDIVSGLETLDDLLAEAEDVLEVIEEILETLSAYLPPEVVEELQQAQETLSTAQSTGDPEDISAAQDALETANQHFQSAMTELLTRVLDIIIESLNQLDMEFSSVEEQTIAGYENAIGDLSAFEQEQNGSYAITGNTNEQGVFEMEEVTWYEEDLTNQQAELASNNQSMNDLISLSQEYYERVFAYGQMKAIQQLKAEISTNADLIPFLSALMNKDIHLLDFIGTEIAEGKTNEEIIPEVKTRILEGVNKVLRRM